MDPISSDFGVSSRLLFTDIHAQPSAELWNNHCILENPPGVAFKTARALQPAAYNMSSGRAEQYRGWSKHSHIHTLRSADKSEEHNLGLNETKQKSQSSKKLTEVCVESGAKDGQM